MTLPVLLILEAGGSEFYVVLLVVGILGIWTNLAPICVFTLLHTVLLHHHLAVLLRHLLAMLLVDCVAHLPRLWMTFLHWDTAALLACDRIADFMGDFLAVRSNYSLAMLLRHFVTLLSWHQVALFLGNIHAVLFRHCIAVLSGNQLALLLRHVATLLLGHVVADWLGHILALLLGDVLALLLAHLVTSLVGHFLAVGHRVRLTNTSGHFMAPWPWMCLVCLPMTITSLVSSFCVPLSFGLPPAPIMGPPVPKEAPVVYQASCSCWVNSMLARVGRITVGTNKGRMRMGRGGTNCVIDNLTSCLYGLLANLLVLHHTLLVLNRVALLFKDSLTLFLLPGRTHLLLMSVADVLIHSGALLFLGRLTVLFWDRATHWVGDDNTSTLLHS